MSPNAVLLRVTERISRRSAESRARYLALVAAARRHAPVRKDLPCTNLAHAFAAAAGEERALLRGGRWPNIAIVSAYNDMLSAHQPFERYPAIIKRAVREVGAVAQFAGGVPAMCDGVTQGEAGMDLSLFSRDVIALATAVALSHNVFDGVLCLGVCDKIVPGLLIGALRFGHLPAIFVPAGPMPSGISNAEKAAARQRHAQGLIDDAGLMETEQRAYHSAGTCTFYGTANSNQMLMEVMGLHVPGAAFVNPLNPLREALTAAAAARVCAMTAAGAQPIALADIVDARAIVNGIVGLLATGGSTNHTIHLVAIAAAAGIKIDWEDFADLSSAVPLLARVYPNGEADVNAFEAAGGTAFLVRELLDAGLLHEDVTTVMGPGLRAYTARPELAAEGLVWRPAAAESEDPSVLAPYGKAFAADGGLKLLTGNLGRAVMKVSAVKPAHRRVAAPALVFDSQEAVQAAFARGALDRDFVAVVRFQGPRANGMPELHKLTPVLGVLQDRGFRVALVTDGRMSGASGKVPAAIHVSPECLAGGPLARVVDGDPILVDGERGLLEAQVDAAIWAARPTATVDLLHLHQGMGRELFGRFRDVVGGAEAGACSLAFDAEEYTGTVTEHDT